MEGFPCPNCDSGDIVMMTGPKRRMRYRQIPDLELPEALALPTCTSCGEHWLDAEATKQVERALELAYSQELQRKSERAIEKLQNHIPQRDLERLLGLSSGWLSKIKHGREPSASITALLMLLAEQRHRVDELQQLWSVKPTRQQVVEFAELVGGTTGISRPALFAPRPPLSTDISISVGTEASAEIKGLMAA